GATCRPSRMQSSSTGKDSPTWAARSLPARALWMCRSAPKYVLVTVTDTGAPSIGTVTSPSAGSNETAPAPAGSGSVTVQTPPPGTVTSKPPPVAGRVTTSPSMTVRSPRVQSTLIRGSDAAYVASPSTCLTTLRVETGKWFTNCAVVGVAAGGRMPNWKPSSVGTGSEPFSTSLSTHAAPPSTSCPTLQEAPTGSPGTVNTLPAGGNSAVRSTICSPLNEHTAVSCCSPANRSPSPTLQACTTSGAASKSLTTPAPTVV